MFIIHNRSGEKGIIMNQHMFSYRWSYLSVLFIIIAFISIGCGGGGSSAGSPIPPPFSSSDLSGAWHIFVASAGGANEGTASGIVILNASGQITGGSYTRSDGTVASLTGGVINIDYGSGIVSGDITTSIGVNLTIFSGKMELSKNTISFVDRTNYGEFDFVTAIRDGGTFASSDLSGTWHIFVASTGGTNEGTAGGTVILNSSGQVTGGSYTRSDGTVASLIGGVITIDGSGIVSGNVITNTGVTLTIMSGKMDLSKNTISFVDSTNSGELDFITAIRDGGTFASSDLSGTWYIFVASTGGTNEGTAGGTVILNSSGQITGGSYSRSDGTVDSLTGGVITIDGSGIVSGNLTTGTGVTLTIISGKMELSKNTISFVDRTNYGELDFITAIKSN